MKKKKTGRRGLSFLLTLAMVVGLMPGMVMTAYAAGHTHSFTYSAEGDTITATCQNDGCSLTENKVTLTIGDPANIYYNDNTSSHDFTLVGLEDFNQATGKTISVSDIVYYKGDNQSQDIKKNTVKGTTYKARLTVEGVRAEHSFKFTEKPNPHTHSFSYTANGAVITATCTQNASNMEACGLTNKQATLTLNAPLHTTYGDGKDANATLTGEIPGVTNPTIHYSKGDAPLSSAPTDAGTYKAWCQLGNATARVEYTITKAINSGWTTKPKAKQNLKYTGQPQALITAGTASAGSALYTVGTDPNNEPDVTAGGRPYTSAVPEMTNAGTYYVWCKIDGGKNYTSINAQKVKVTIARANITPSVSIVGWTYGQTANTPMVGDTDNPGNGEVTYTYKVKDADDSTYTSTVPTKAGNYTVKAVIAETTNYNSGVATKDFTISKAANPAAVTRTATVMRGGNTVDLADNVTLNGATGAVTYTIKGEANGCTLSGSMLTSGDNTGSVTVNVSVAADNNYNALATTPITVTISDKGTQTITASDVTATYGETNKKVEATTDGNGAISYAVKEGSVDYIDVDATTGALTIKKAGTATVVVTAAETGTYAQATKEVTVTINKANAVAATVTANNRTYDGKANALVTAGKTEGGTLMYRLGTDGKWQQDIPEATDAGTYKIYYYIKGDDNHNDDGSEKEPKGSVETTIKKAAQDKPTETFATTEASDDKTADGKISGLDKAKTYQYSADDGKTWTDVKAGSTEIVVKSGTYQIRYAEDKNHEAGKAASVTVTAKVAPSPEPAKTNATINLKSVTQKNNKVQVRWTKVNEADGYDVYIHYCGSKAKKASKTIKGNSTTSVSFKKIDGKKINQKKNFRVKVYAYKMVKGKKKIIAKTITAHLAGTKSVKYTNPKALKLTKSTYSIKVGKTAKIKAKVTRKNSKKKLLPKSHAAKLRYKSSNTKIATVNKNGTIKGKKKGTCYIYVYTVNGLMKKVKVTVK